MRKYNLLLISISLLFIVNIKAQTSQDTIAIRQVALDYIESQHNVNPAQMERALHPRMVKRTFWKNKTAKREYLRETFKDNMSILAEVYNIRGDKFPDKPKKEVKLLDVSDKTASIKLIADDWIDYMHIVKINGKWKIVNVLWQFNDSSKH